jgi:ornithine--oxo-acid transaminase
MTALDVLIEENLADRAQRLGEQFRSGIRSLRSPLVKEVRGRGLFNAIVIDESASERGRTAWQFCLLLKSRGVLAKPTHVNMYAFAFFLILKRLAKTLTCFMYHFSKSIRFTPPLVISEEDLQHAIEVIRQALIDLDLVRGPLLPSRYRLTTLLLHSSRRFREKSRARRVSGMN